jgi:hypothetical protein
MKMNSVHCWTRAWRKASFLLALAAGFFLPVTAHAYCYGITSPIAPPSPPGHVCGTIYKFGYNGSSHYWKAAGTSYVKICPAGSTSSCAVSSTGSYKDGYGNPVQAFAFPYYRQGASGYQNFDFYVWGYYSDDFWGSSTKPLGRFSIGPGGLEGLQMAMPPRPLEPTPVYPSGTSVPNAYTVRWKSGVDIDRKPYPAIYEVWFKYWPFGGTEPASWSLSTNTLPCHANGTGPDLNNECSTYVSGPQLAGNWKWYVVANFDMNGVVTTFPNTVFTTQAPWVGFIQPQ